MTIKELKRMLGSAEVQIIRVNHLIEKRYTDRTYEGPLAYYAFMADKSIDELKLIENECLDFYSNKRSNFLDIWYE